MSERKETPESLAHDAFLRAKSLLALVNSRNFKLALNNVSDYIVVNELVKKSDTLAIHKWIKANLPFETLTLNELKQMGRDSGIKNWCRIPKSLLIFHLRRDK